MTFASLTGRITITDMDEHDIVWGSLLNLSSQLEEVLLLAIEWSVRQL
jgi:hypothetical protein